MTRMTVGRIRLAPTTTYLLTALVLTLAGCFLILVGAGLEPHSAPYLLLHVLGVALLSLGWIELLHEYFVARRVREEFIVLGDFMTKGIERICTKDEITPLGIERLEKSQTLSVVGIGLSWLVTNEQNRLKLEALLASNRRVRILIPDPTSPEMEARYRDEPAEFDIGLPGLATRARAWAGLAARYPSLEVRAFDRYPVCTITAYDHYTFVAPVLFRRRAKDAHTAVFRRPSLGASIYEEHLNLLFEHGSKPLDKAFLDALHAKYPPTPG